MLISIVHREFQRKCWVARPVELRRYHQELRRERREALWTPYPETAERNIRGTT